MNTRKFSFILLFVCLALACNQAVFALDIVKYLADGVTLTQSSSDNPAFPMLTNILSVDLSSPGIKLRAALGKDVIFSEDIFKGRESIANLVERKQALAGVNADYFPMEWGGDPLGVCVVDGELVSEPCGNRAAIALTKSNGVIFDIPASTGYLQFADSGSIKLDGINRPRGTGQVIVYTSAFGSKISAKYPASYVKCQAENLPLAANKTIRLTAIEVVKSVLELDIAPGTVVLAGGGTSAKLLEDKIKPGDSLSLRFGIGSSNGSDWSLVDQAVGGGPWLVRNGAIYIDGDAEGFGPDIVKSVHPRTAVGVTSDNKLLLVTVDGRQGISKGLDIKELAALMLRLGCFNAINLDGGGSTTLAVQGLVVNSPSGGIERLVANALLVVSENQPGAAQPLEITGLGSSIAAGDVAYLGVPASVDASRVIWGTKSGMGFVDQLGRYSPTKARTGLVGAAYKGSVTKQEVTVVPGETDKITAKLTRDAVNPAVYLLTVTAVDKYGNPASFRAADITVTGGCTDQATVATDAAGKCSAIITWTAPLCDRSLQVQIDSIKTKLKP